MADNRKSFTFFWKIEKFFSFSYFGKNFVSPLFFVPEMSGHEFKINVSVDPGLNKVQCYICRSGDDIGSYELILDYEVSFLSGDGTVLKSKTFLKKVIETDYDEFLTTLDAGRDDVFFLKKDQFLPDDTLTVRSRFWKSEESISRAGRGFIKTRPQIECLLLSGTINYFSCIATGVKYPLNIESSSSENFSFSMNISIAADSFFLNIEIKPLKSIEYYKCEIFVLNKYDIEVKSGQSESKFSVNELLSIPLTFSKEYLMKNKEYFLPDDALTILCKIILPGEYISEIEYIFYCEDTQARSTDVSSDDACVENLTTLKDDWNSLFREGILSDAKLKTATETFPVHSVVLSARSPVFKSMFTNDMKEKTNRCVEIDDLDADTVRRMLMFVYSDSLDDLEYESAKSLYFASDKYNIVSLKQRCSNFLKQNLLQSNCVGILLLADEHQDKDLKNAVQDYIAKDDEAVLNSDEWKNLEENPSRLTMEVFRFIYMKNRKS